MRKASCSKMMAVRLFEERVPLLLKSPDKLLKMHQYLPQVAWFFSCSKTALQSGSEGSVIHYFYFKITRSFAVK